MKKFLIKKKPKKPSRKTLNIPIIEEMMRVTGRDKNSLTKEIHEIEKCLSSFKSFKNDNISIGDVIFNIETIQKYFSKTGLKLNMIFHKSQFGYFSMYNLYCIRSQTDDEYNEDLEKYRLKLEKYEEWEIENKDQIEEELKRREDKKSLQKKIKKLKKEMKTL